MGKLSHQTCSWINRSLLGIGLITCLCWLTLVNPGHAVETAKPLATAPAVTGGWNTLTLSEQQALGPLQTEWNQLGPDQKKKWLLFASKYQQMKPEEQTRAQEKMQTWVKLTPEQRLAARENYLRSNNLHPDQRNQKWQEYQQLTDEQKTQLASHPEKKKLITALPTPAESRETKLQPLKTPHKSAAAPAPALVPSAAPAAVPALLPASAGSSSAIQTTK